MRSIFISFMLVVVGCSSSSKKQASNDSQGSSAAPTIDREAIRQTIRGDISQIRKCYEAELKTTPDLKGKVVIKWEIDGAGKVSNAKVDQEKSDLKNSNVETCVTSEISKLTFPKAPTSSSVSVLFPFYFKNE